MQLKNLVTLQQVVAVLNVQPPSREEQFDFANRYLAAAGSLPRKETRPFTAALLSYTLRNYVDAWLRKGHRADGREFPWERQVSPVGLGAILQYMQQYPAQVDFSPQDGLIVYISDGEGHPVGPGKLFEAVDAEAKRLFTGLMVQEQKQCLCRCANADCGRYFLLAKPRRVYKHGTFCCRSHQMAASARTLTRIRRTKAKERLFEMAARQLVDWKVRTTTWANDGRLKIRLATTLSQLIGRNPNLRARGHEVKVNWVTWHCRQIEQQRVQIQRSQRPNAGLGGTGSAAYDGSPPGRRHGRFYRRHKDVSWAELWPRDHRPMVFVPDRLELKTIFLPSGENWASPSC